VRYLVKSCRHAKLQTDCVLYYVLCCFRCLIYVSICSLFLLSHRARRKILTLEEGFTTQVVTLWCFNTVDPQCVGSLVTVSYKVLSQHSGAQDFDLGGGFHYSGSYSIQRTVTSSYPMVFQAFNTVLGGREFFSVAFVMAPFRTDPL
jgi:hypothetical protein